MNPLEGIDINVLLDAVAVDIEPIEELVEDTKRLTVFNDSHLDAETTRRLRMSQVIAKFASTLTLRPIKVEVSTRFDPNHQSAPAWSDSDNIWFNQEELGELSDPKTVLSLKGLSLHEISHILLTPRTGSNLAKDVQRESLWRAFNALEDQRIEMMMTKRFGNVSDWLAAAVAQFLVKEPNQWPVAFPLTYGRKYLPKELRDQLVTMYENPRDVARIKQLIDQYIVLNLSDPANYPTALDIIREFHLLVENLAPVPNPNQWGMPEGGWSRVKDPAGHEQRKNGEWKSSQSKPMPKAEQSKLAGRVQDAIDSDNAGSPSSGDPSEGDGGDGTYGSGVSKSGGSVTSMAEDIISKVMVSKASDIAHTLKQYGADIDLTSINAKAPQPLEGVDLMTPENDASQASRSFANELERMRRDYDPGWNRRTEAGKLNVQRYVTGCEVDEAFDEWDMGREDAVDIEAVILLDISGSMGSLAKGAYQSMWAIKRALDKVNASTTVIAFDHESHLVYSSAERAGTRMKYTWCRGGTDPLSSLKYSKNILAESNRAIKLCIVLTDGSWGTSDESDKLIREFRRAGVLTGLGFMHSEEYEIESIDSHGAEVAVDVTDMSHLVTLARMMVKLGIARNLNNS
jgi:hypothetical protein